MDTQPYVIAVASEKGGVGKSTLAASLATYWASIGYRVLCADLDPQGTLLEWDGVGSDAAGEGRPTVIPVANNVRRSLPQVWSGYDIVVMDTPGRMDQRLGEALMIGLAAATAHGFNDLFKHLTLRLLLWAQHSVPLNYARLLDAATDAVLLQKVGGGYTFRHRLLQEHFAAEEK